MDHFSKRKECTVTFEEIRRALEDWQISERIREKIDIWGLRYSAKKVLHA